MLWLWHIIPGCMLKKHVLACVQHQSLWVEMTWTSSKVRWLQLTTTYGIPHCTTADSVLGSVTSECSVNAQCIHEKNPSWSSSFLSICFLHLYWVACPSWELLGSPDNWLGIVRVVEKDQCHWVIYWYSLFHYICFNSNHPRVLKLTPK